MPINVTTSGNHNVTGNSYINGFLVVTGSTILSGSNTTVIGNYNVSGSSYLSGSVYGPNFYITPEGGYAVGMFNGSGAVSVKGSVVHCSSGSANSWNLTPASDASPIGIVYNSGVAISGSTWIVIAGIAQVLLKDGTATSVGNWAMTSNVIGRADITTTSPPGAAVQHWQELGHSIENVTAGVDKLARCVIHFN